jgi:hypothetical protein
MCWLPALLEAAPNPGRQGGTPRHREWGINFSNPMEFALAQDGIGNDVVFAAGNISGETVDNFLTFLDAHKIGPGAVVVLHSNGNDALAGMQLGRLIRQRSLQTSVGQKRALPSHAPSNREGSADLIEPGECDSACALAFMGGVYREVPPGSLYVIHAIGARVPDLKGGATDPSISREFESGFFMGQVVAGDVEQYLLEMGIESEFLLRYRQYDSRSHRAFPVPQDTLRSWRVVNADVETEWSLAVRHHRFALVGINPDSAFMPRQHEEVAFRCEGPKRASMEIAYLPPPGPADPGAFSGPKQYELASSSSHVRSVVQTGKEEAAALSVIDPSDILEPFQLFPGDPRVRGTIDMTPRLLALLASSPRVVKFGFRLAGGRFYGFPVDFHAIRKAFFNFVAACA